MKTQKLIFFIISIMALGKIAYADETNFGKQTPSTNQVINALKPTTSDNATENSDYEGDIKENNKQRSINMGALKADHQNQPKPKIKVQHNKTINTENTQTETALSMEIIFGYKSAELTENAKNQLKPVGEAMISNQLQNLNFIVEGHTDAIGSDAYNMNLSEERASSVKHYLIDTFHIDASRIQIIGKGKNDLLDPKNPDSEVNRRVRIIAKK